MESVIKSEICKDVKKELNYSFGNVYIFSNFVVSEINEGVNFNWHDHGEKIVEDVTYYLGNDGSEIIYISNRVNDYSVVATDWLKYFSSSYRLKAYFIISNSRVGYINSKIENLFFNNRIKHFISLTEAIHWIDTKLVNTPK
ncbi:hypothetical protein AW14_09470 [Siansivirga zeaxanthinifaciens CC-SAMT-1]|uniref:STAS/SEC14 domain-containing protein n=1 Tax=Siansivirga zeaxanthinifaciens CC-SAMT-1 TaxID=1454006 RepID=A0A0C5WLW4_9FLAO|nr:hypothetical protein AW14_09470 [Siansivirga zeaxanthinifaciens CC-SAMT-1]